MKKILFLLIILLSGELINAATYYVSSTGNDSSNGSQSSLAWRTINKVNSVNFSAGDQILFRRGDTFYGTISVNSSGNSSNPIVFGSYGSGDNPVISGFSSLSNWTNEGGGVYSTIVSSQSQTNMVLMNGVITAMGRYPDNTFLTYESANGNKSITDNQLSGSPNWIGAELVHKKNKWSLLCSPITSHSGNTITFTNSDGQTSRDGYGYFIQNDRRTLSQLGEWYHDLSAGKFYMYFGSISPNSREIKVATLDNVLYLRSKNYITIQNLTLEGAINDGLSLQGYISTGIIIQNCTIQFAGNNAVALDGCINSKILSNAVDQCTSGIFVKESGGDLISDNVVTNIGLVFGTSKKFAGYQGIRINQGNLSWQPQQTTIQYNSVNSVGYNGISFQGNNVKVLNNFVHSACLRLDDGAGIYTAGDAHAGREVQNNIIINARGNYEGTIDTKYMGSGIFLDDFGANILVQGNTAIQCGKAGMKIHRANSNTIYNNTFYDNPRGLLMENWDGVSRLFNIKMQNNRFIAKSADQNCLEMYTTVYETFSELNNNCYARPIDDTNTILYQLLPGSRQRLSVSGWKGITGKDANSTKSAQTISNESDFQFEYNSTKAAKTVILSQPMIDIYGNKYVGSVSLQPYTSLVLLKDKNPDPDSTRSPAVANFTVKTSGVVTNEILSFTNASSNATAYLWNFGDEQTSSLTNPTHSYSSVGNYTATLTAYSEGGNSSKSVVINIAGTITTPNPDPDPIPNPDPAPTPDPTNNSGNLLSDDFSDGSMNGWTIVDEGTTNGPSVWSASSQQLIQSSDIYNAPDGDAFADGRQGTFSYWNSVDAFGWSEYQFTTVLSSIDNDGIGVMFYYQDTDNYYRFEMDRQRGFRKLTKTVNGEVALLMEDDFVYIENQNYVLDIYLKGQTIVVLFDDETLFSSIVSNGLSEGTVALFSWGNSGANFDNILVGKEQAVTNPEAQMSDDFSDENMNGWTIVDEGTFDGPSNWSVSNGELVQSSNLYSASFGDDRVGTFAYWNASDAASWKDYTISLDMKSNDDDGYGVMFYYKDEDNYFRFEMDMQRSFRKLIRKSNGVVQVIYQDNEAYSQGVIYSVEISMDNGNVQIDINGEEFYSGDVSDAILTGGTVALYSWGNAGTYFDNVAVSKEGVIANPQAQMSEDFSGGNLNGWTIVDEGTFDGPSNWAVSNGELVQSSNLYSASFGDDRVGTFAYWNDAGAASWENYTISLEMQSNDDDGYGVMFYYKDEDNYYRFEMDMQRSFRKLVKKTNGLVQVIYQDTEAYSQGVRYLVDITMNNGNAQITIDGDEFYSGDISDDALNGGAIALYSWGNSSTYFDNVAVFTDGAVDPSEDDLIDNLNDDFEDGNMTGWTVIDEGEFGGASNWSVSAGQLIQVSNIYSASFGNDRVGTFAYWNDPSALVWSDYTLSVNLQSNDDDGFGIMFYYQDPDNYYRLEMDNQRAFRRLIKKTNGVVEVIYQDQVAYTRGIQYSIYVSMNNGNVSIEIGGEGFYTGDVSDAALTQGAVALYCWGNAGTIFDDVVVTDNSAITKSGNLSNTQGSSVKENQIDSYESGNTALGIKIWPNPAINHINVTTEKDINGVVMIYNLSGSLILSNVIHDSNTMYVNLEDIQQGVYILRILDTEMNSVLYQNKLVVQ